MSFVAFGSFVVMMRMWLLGFDESSQDKEGYTWLEGQQIIKVACLWGSNKISKRKSMALIHEYSCKRKLYVSIVLFLSPFPEMQGTYVKEEGS